jgi:hypothetical protein
MIESSRGEKQAAMYLVPQGLIQWECVYLANLIDLKKQA